MRSREQACALGPQWPGHSVWFQVQGGVGSCVILTLPSCPAPLVAACIPGLSPALLWPSTALLPLLGPVQPLRASPEDP